MRLAPLTLVLVPVVSGLVVAGALPAAASGKTRVASTTTSVTAPVTTAVTAPVAAVVSPCAVLTDRVVPVTTVTELKAALAAALPGDRITLADGTYAGTFALSRSGTALSRIHVCGTSAAVLDGGSTLSGYGVSVKASYVDLVGFSVTNVQKGVVVDGGAYDVLDSLTVSNTGDEAVHLRTNSHDNTVSNSTIHHTGLRVAGYGEGVYVGSANNNWCTYTACNPDHSDYNTVKGNTFYAMGAEAVDIKEGTVGGTVSGNSFDGTGSSALSWVDVKGNSWVVTGNKGKVSLRDGFLTEIAVTGWGTKNQFLLNTADVQGPGYGLRVGAGNLVACTNIVTNALKGYSSVACTR